MNENEFSKRKNAVKKFSINWEDWLVTDTISTSTWVVPTGITKDADSKTNTTTTIKLSGGTPNQVYICTNRITTVTSGETEEKDIYIYVTK